MVGRAVQVVVGKAHRVDEVEGVPRQERGHLAVAPGHVGAAVLGLVVADRESAGSAEGLVGLVARIQPGIPVVVMSVPWAAGSTETDLAKPLSGPQVRRLAGQIRDETPRLFELPSAA